MPVDRVDGGAVVDAEPVLRVLGPAEARQARQTSTASEDDFFAESTGRAVSNGERLPF